MAMPEGRIPIAEEEGQLDLGRLDPVGGSEGSWGPPDAIDVNEHVRAPVLAWARGLPAPWFIHCDLRDIAALRAAVDEARARLGPIRVLVSSAAHDERPTPPA